MEAALGEQGAGGVGGEAHVDHRDRRGVQVVLGRTGELQHAVAQRQDVRGELAQFLEAVRAQHQWPGRGCR
ncbi:MAG: hypothetical protein U0802_13910 [Candidatus Binatia bacterium]